MKAELARRSLSRFVEDAWHVVEPTTDFKSNWHIDAIAEHLEAVSNGQIRKLLINMPPRHMKSLAVSVFWPCWEWLTHPSTRWLFSSYALDLAIRDSVKCRRLITSSWYQENWADVYQLTGDQNVKSRFENDHTGYRLTASVDSAVTGEGGDRLVVDDPHNVREARSTPAREAAISWWREAMSTRGNDPHTVARVIVMQRVHEADLSAYVLSEGGWDHLCLPAEYEGPRSVSSIGWQDPRRENGELLWPGHFDRQELDDLKRTLGSYGSAGQLQQRPAPEEGGLFKRVWWRFWHPKGMNPPPVVVQGVECVQIELPELPTILQSWDMSFKDTQASAFVSGQVWGAAEADRFLLDEVHQKLDFVATLRAFQDLTNRHPFARAKIVEDKANGPAVIASLKHRIAGIIPYNPHGSKEERAAAVSPQVESGNVYLPHPRVYPWVDSFINELATFPNGEYMDRVDAMSQALTYLEKRGGKKASSHQG